MSKAFTREQDSADDEDTLPASELPSDDDFLAVPREVLVTSMAKNQRYFPVEDGDGRLLPAFVAVTNSPEGAADNVQRFEDGSGFNKDKVVEESTRGQAW